MQKILRLGFGIAITITFQLTAASQSLSVNTTGAVAHPSAILDVSSDTKGMLIPRVSKAERNAIASPATGLMVFQNNPDSTGFYYYSGSSWVWLTDALNADTTGWKISGNSNITASRFLGTLNDSALQFRVNNQPSGLVDSISFNTSLGYGTLRNVNYAGGNQGKDNSAFGFGALDSLTTGQLNTAVGSFVLKNNTTGQENTSTGSFSSFINTSGSGNTANGYLALSSNTTGSSNTAIGKRALGFSTSGSGNTGVGIQAGLFSTGSYNTYMGYLAGNGASGRSTGDRNTGVGYNSLARIGSGTRNVAIGNLTLLFDSSGSYNVAIGSSAAQARVRGDANVLIGYYAGETDSISDNTIFIGNIAGQYNQRSNIIGIGTESLKNNGAGLITATAGDSALYNTGLGNQTLLNNTKGGWNTGIGYNAARANTTGFNNVALGVSALLNTTVSDNNTAIGSRAGDGFNNGPNNTFLGYLSNANADGRINATAIGANALVSQDNSLVLGSINGLNGATANTLVGIGISAPTTTLDVRGNFLLGTNGTAINEIIKLTVVGDIPGLGSNGTGNFTLAVPNAVAGSTVSVSPATVLIDGTTIAYGLVTAANVVTVYVGNVTTGVIAQQLGVSFNVTVIR